MEKNTKLMEDAEVMHIRNELETEKLKEQRWQAVMEQLKQAREHTAQEHAKVLEEIKKRVQAAKGEASSRVLDCFKRQVSELNPPAPTEEEQRAKFERERNPNKHQEEIIHKKLAELQGQQAWHPDTLADLSKGLTSEGSRSQQEL